MSTRQERGFSTGSFYCGSSTCLLSIILVQIVQCSAVRALKLNPIDVLLLLLLLLSSMFVHIIG